MRKKIIYFVLALSMAFAGFILPTTEIKAANPTFLEQFPNAHTAEVIAGKFGKLPTEQIDSVDVEATYLDLISKNLTDITGIEIFTNLETLNLGGNELTSVQTEIGMLTKLQALHLWENKLTELPESIGQLTQLKNLYIHSNKITELPESIGQLTNLRILHVYRNELTEFPSSFTSLVNLEILNISQNNIHTLPEGIGNLSKLTHVEAQYNLITKLPESIGNATGIKNLIINRNQLTSLPESLVSLSSLRNLWLADNLLPSDYPAVLDASGITEDGQPIIHEQQDQLEIGVNDVSFAINNQADIDNIDYRTFVQLSSELPLSPAHDFILENYRDENMLPVLLTDYIENGIVQKSGKVYAQVRATGTGLFPNTSDHAVTTDFIELRFEATYYNLSFDLNGKTGTTPATQILREGQFGTAVDIPITDGYLFTSWNTKQDGTGIEWDFEVTNTIKNQEITNLGTSMPAQDIVLYAQWEANEQEETSTNIPPAEETSTNNPPAEETGTNTLPEEETGTNIPPVVETGNNTTPISVEDTNHPQTLPTTGESIMPILFGGFIMSIGIMGMLLKRD